MEDLQWYRPRKAAEKKKGVIVAKTITPQENQLGTSANGRCDIVKCLAGFLAEQSDCSDGHHDDQRYHDRVFHSGRAVFTLQEFHQVLLEGFHHGTPFEVNETFKNRYMLFL